MVPLCPFPIGRRAMGLRCLLVHTVVAVLLVHGVGNSDMFPRFLLHPDTLKANSIRASRLSERWFVLLHEHHTIRSVLHVRQFACAGPTHLNHGVRYPFR